METLFNKRLQVYVKCKDCEERLTDDLDPYFLYSLSISEEDYQSLKVQQGLLIDFASFPQKFIDLLHLCLSEQELDSPRFLLHLACQSSAHDAAAHFSVVETNAFKHLNHLSLKLLQGSDKEVKDYLATCLSSLKDDKQSLEARLKKTEEDLSRQLTYAQQDLMSEREKALEIQGRLQQQVEHVRQELEASHQRTTQQLQSRLAELEASTRELTERRYKNESSIRDLQIKLASAEENGTLDTALHERERTLGGLQTRLAVLEQEVKDKEQLMGRTREVLEATQQQKETMEGNVESKDHQIRKLGSTVKSRSEELVKANCIIKRLQADVRALAEKMKVKNCVTVSQEKVVQETSDKLQAAGRLLQEAQQQLTHKDQEVSKLKEQLETTVQKLSESKEVLKTNENVIGWLNKQLNDKQLLRKPPSPETLQTPSTLHTTAGLRAQFYPMAAKPGLCPADATDFLPAPQKLGEPGGLDSKYFERRDDSIPLPGLLSNLHAREFPPRPLKQAIPSAYFSA
ncbi:hypothetical protein CRUP_037676 [Coryphaenoides rupestris]|nr:hypothetical protein CRUP_037676 [Coryphaenoides rupestris]